jgi:hypothetical protein
MPTNTQTESANREAAQLALRNFAENALRFFYAGDEGIMLSPHRAEEFNRLHQELFELVRHKAIKNVIAKE